MPLKNQTRQSFACNSNTLFSKSNYDGVGDDFGRKVSWEKSCICKEMLYNIFFSFQNIVTEGAAIIGVYL